MPKMNTYVYLYTISSYICVNPSVLPHNLSRSQARADKTWQSSWVARRSSYQRSKQSNMRSGSQTRSNSCFAQVRAESCENDARDAPGKPKK